MKFNFEDVLYYIAGILVIVLSLAVLLLMVPIGIMVFKLIGALL